MNDHLAARQRVDRDHRGAKLERRPLAPAARPCSLCGVPMWQHPRCSSSTCGLLLGDAHGQPIDASGHCSGCRRPRAAVGTVNHGPQRLYGASALAIGVPIARDKLVARAFRVA